MDLANEKAIVSLPRRYGKPTEDKNYSNEPDIYGSLIFSAAHRNALAVNTLRNLGLSVQELI